MPVTPCVFPGMRRPPRPLARSLRAAAADDGADARDRPGGAPQEAGDAPAGGRP